LALTPLHASDEGILARLVDESMTQHSTGRRTPMLFFEVVNIAWHLLVLGFNLTDTLLLCCEWLADTGAAGSLFIELGQLRLTTVSPSFKSRQ
jgi:hypothetical protein